MNFASGATQAPQNKSLGAAGRAWTGRRQCRAAPCEWQRSSTAASRPLTPLRNLSRPPCTHRPGRQPGAGSGEGPGFRSAPAAAPLCTSPYLAAFGPRARPRRPLPLTARSGADSPPQASRPARPGLLDVLGASRARDGLGSPALLLLRDVVLQNEPQPSAPTPGSPRAACCPPGGPRSLQPRRAGPGFARDRTTRAGASKGGPEGSRARTGRGSGRGIARRAKVVCRPAGPAHGDAGRFVPSSEGRPGK